MPPNCMCMWMIHRCVGFHLDDQEVVHYILGVCLQEVCLWVVQIYLKFLVFLEASSIMKLSVSQITIGDGEIAPSELVWSNGAKVHNEIRETGVQHMQGAW